MRQWWFNFCMRYTKFYQLSWCIREWFERVYYCHHNARVLADMESRMCDVVYHATGGKMSKAYYDTEVVKSVIDDYTNEIVEEALKEQEQELA